jgi:hypothetical protein
VDDDAIRALVTRLAQPHASGGEAIERAAILAEGADFPSILEWITDHHGVPEAAVSASRGQGLHGARLTSGGGGIGRPPARYVLPAGSLA